jgi:PTS system sucrose-specific IIC component
MQYIITIAIAIGVSFVLTWILWKDEEPKKTEQTPEQTQQITVEEQKAEIKSEDKTVYSPIKGKVIALSSVKDETFAGEFLGKGVAIQPEEGKVVAPFDGKVTVVMDTKHAIGMTSDSGVEILIHVGMDTVQLNGKHYQTHVNVDDVVKKGDLLLTFDKEAIVAEGYEITTPVVVTNTTDFKQVNGLAEIQAQKGDVIINIE